MTRSFNELNFFILTMLVLLNIGLTLWAHKRICDLEDSKQQKEGGDAQL